MCYISYFPLNPFAPLRKPNLLPYICPHRYIISPKLGSPYCTYTHTHTHTHTSHIGSPQRCIFILHPSHPTTTSTSPQYYGLCTYHTNRTCNTEYCMYVVSRIVTRSHSFRLPRLLEQRSSGGKLCKCIKLVLNFCTVFDIFLSLCAKARREKRSGIYIFTSSLINPITELCA